MSRDVNFESAWLESVEHDAGVDVGWRTRVRARLQWAQGKHGDRWLKMRLRNLLQEIRSETEDLGGWPVLAAQIVHAASELDEREAIHLLALLRHIAAYGAMADELVGQALDILGER